MPEEPAPPAPHQRRPRYAGKHPRRFGEKYKEHAAEAFPETVAKVLASGKTPAGMHVAVMPQEVLGVLAPGPGMRGVDATLGFGGHAERILARLQPGGHLIGIDQDPLQLPRTEARLRALGFGPDCFTAVRSNFAGLPKIVAESGPVDFLLADLGCSSMQIDDPERGFTFKHDGPLDMRMNPARGIPASNWLRKIQPDALAAILRDNADIEAAEQLAAALAGRDWNGTRKLADGIRKALGTGAEEDSAERVVRLVFQAIRIAVNDEFGALDTLLRNLPACLQPSGRAAFLTFHSGEDRRVKKFIQDGQRRGTLLAGDVGPQVATADERRSNPRAASAKLRWLVMC